MHKIKQLKLRTNTNDAICCDIKASLTCKNSRTIAVQQKIQTTTINIFVTEQRTKKLQRRTREYDKGDKNMIASESHDLYYCRYTIHYICVDKVNQIMRGYI